MIRDIEGLNGLTEPIARVVRDRLIPAEARVEEDNAIPGAIVDEMRQLGLFSLSIPEEFGRLAHHGMRSPSPSSSAMPRRRFLCRA